MLRRHLIVALMISSFAVSLWSCKSPAGPDDSKNGTQKVATVYVYSEPWHANIWLDGADTLKRTYDFLEGVPLGTHVVMILKPGYIDWKITFTLTEAYIRGGYTINAKLEPQIITVTNPTSKTVWIKGEIALITWEPKYIPPPTANTDHDASSLTANDDGPGASDRLRNLYLPTVKLSLYKGDIEITTIVSDIENKGFYSWTINPSLESGTDYKVRVQATPETPAISLVHGVSEPFTIK